MSPLRTALAGATLLALATACAPASGSAGPGVVWVSTAPPPLLVETRPASPGSDYVWVRGTNQWNGAAYNWVPGSWERRPSPRAKWVPARWHHGRQGWRYTAGHWKH